MKKPRFRLKSERGLISGRENEGDGTRTRNLRLDRPML